MLFGYPLVLELYEEVVLSEDLLEAGRLGKGVVIVVTHQGLEHVSTQAARGGDDPLAVI